MDLNYLKGREGDYLEGREGDRINAMLAAAGCNSGRLPRWLADILPLRP